jgi:hypothetical protein
MHDGNKINLKSMTSEQILEDDLATTSRVKRRKNIRVRIRLLMQIFYHLKILLNLIETMLVKFI